MSSDRQMMVGSPMRVRDEHTKSDVTIEAYAWIRDGAVAHTAAFVKVGPGLGPHTFGVDTLEAIRDAFDATIAALDGLDVADLAFDEPTQLGMGLS